ncbi:MAG: NTP transferase domain-containing protein [Thermoplasmata archaeon]
MDRTGGEGAWAIVTMDRFGSSLERTHQLLSKRRRGRLAKAILQDVLEAIQGSRLLDRIVVVTHDSDVAAFVRGEGFPVVDPGRKAEAPIRGVIESAEDEGAETVALLRGDLALLEAQDLAFLVGRMAHGAGLVLVPTPGQSGLSIVIATPENGAPGDFEVGGLESWREQAETRGIATEGYGIRAGLRPSGPHDLLVMYTAARPSRGKALLKDWGLGPKLRRIEETEP